MEITEQGPAITREYAEDVARQELQAAGVRVATDRGRLVVLVPFAQVVDSVYQRLVDAHAADVQLARELARPPRAVRRGAGRTR